MEEISSGIQTKPRLWKILKVVFYIFGTLLLFFFAIDLMIASLHHLGRNTIQSIIQAISNPFTGLFAGLLITAMIQSSSATTSLVVAMVASGSLGIESAVPVIMGSNVGTTITSSVISLGFINKKKELKRAVAAGSFHCFFNLLTLLILFPVEYYYGVLSSASITTANYFFPAAEATRHAGLTHPVSAFEPMTALFLRLIPHAYVLIVLSFFLLMASILVFRKLISDLLQASSPEAFSRFFFKSQLKSFFWGILTTAAIRSSTITTSVVVPIVAKKIASFRQAVPFIMGANIGTTITAFIAAIFNVSTAEAASIAIAHFLFNGIGVLIFFPVSTLKKIPMELSRGLGVLTLKYRFAGFAFILITFFFLPFVLLYVSQS